MLRPRVIIRSWQMSYMMIFTPLHMLRAVQMHANACKCLHLPGLIAEAAEAECKHVHLLPLLCSYLCNLPRMQLFARQRTATPENHQPGL